MAPKSSSLASAVLLLIAEATAQVSNAHVAFTTLQEWYNPSTGLWDTAGWWNGANSMTVIADLAAVDASIVQDAIQIFETTFSVAPSVNPSAGIEKNITAHGIMQTTYPAGWPDDTIVATADPTNSTSWLDGANDDAEWWGLAWIAAYDVTGNETYLNLAEGIFNQIASGWGTNCGNGGIYWETTNHYVNAIASELFISLAAHLANRVSDSASTYIAWAEEAWNWFAATGMINSEGTINDGLTSDCVNNGQPVWSYNQGVILGGLAELNRASPNQSYIHSANTIAQAAIAALADSDHVIHDTCEPNCAPDATQFKGIFIRNLLLLHRASPHDLYREVIEACATSIWANDRDTSTNQLSIDWAGPYVSSANSSTHSSAMDALVAVISV
ncbi:glycosyl hydrolase, putative [Talaromyces stipitatus ATCC 10500]|uniref:Glycosyl hydrolase, putative n=1 Tax=Talaromyces stipitatus (strain ATCC 10500 / CBS 375.48 / QM 6759 / NRRL 1006) TaxID=441959 RepID=B8MHZ8_TALSN|nr:glycosyl hydrolase, putative [Talaromyces stipitatus ATCC 10500]EED17160.1 glycosyl hydrolase, putative [Talaromyces stipitatus ATCC 10500]